MSWVIYGLPGNAVTKKKRHRIRPLQKKSVLNVLIKGKKYKRNILLISYTDTSYICLMHWSILRKML